MTVTAVNATKTRFQNGGRILIKTGVATYVSLSNVRPDSAYEYEAGLTDIHHEPDRGVLTTPVNGDQKPTKLRIHAFYTSTVSASELEVLMSTVDNATVDGYRKQYEVTIEQSLYSGATTVKKLVFAKCVVTSLKITAGAKFDQIDVEFDDYESTPTITSGSPTS